MRNVWRLFVGDLKRLRANIVTIITIVGLVALPSIFSWYNMLACWDVFDNTGNLTVAVATTDEGYSSDLVPVQVNIGDRVVAALRENDQLNWTFTDEEDAIDGTRSGRYYAAVVIPPSFSRDMMSFFSDDAEHASIVYYSNEKKNAVAPKVTDQGADQVARQVNLVFTETLSETLLGVSQALARYTDDADTAGVISEMNGHLKRVGTQMGESGLALKLYGDVLDSARSLVEDSGTMLANAEAAARDVADTASGARDAARTVPDTLETASEALSKAIGDSSASFAALPDAIDAAFDSADSLSTDSARQLRKSAADADAVANDYRALLGALNRLVSSRGDPDGALAKVVSRLSASVTLQEQLRDSLKNAADSIEKANSASQADRSETLALAKKVRKGLDDARADFDENLAPVLDQLADAMGDASSVLSSTGADLGQAATRLVSADASVSAELAVSRDEIVAIADKLERTGAEVTGLADQIDQALATGDMQAVRDVVSANPTALAQAISAPVGLERHAVFPIENFGSAMSPLYTTLALWIGALIMMVTLKISPSEKTVSELDEPTPRQLLLGRFGIVAFISLLQSSALALGNLFFLGVQAVNPVLYLICFWVAGLVFAFIIYTLVALFANLGKALAVILLIVQVSGGGGSFPLQLLPGFFQAVSPYLPITHAVNAMRAAMFGVYLNDFWVEIGTLVLFAVPLAILGVLLHAPLSTFVPKFVARVEKSKLM